MLNAEWTPFFAAAVLLALTPGANQLLSLRNALQQGPLDAIVALAGRFFAFALLLAMAVAGLGALLLASEAAFTLVKWCGVAYLLYLGARMLWKSRARPQTQEGPPPAGATRQSRWNLTRQEFLVAATNPKALLLFAAFLPQFTDRAAGSVPSQLAALGLAYIAVEFLAALAYAGVGGRLGAAALTARTRRLFDRMTGATMLAVAGWLALQRR